MSVGPIPDLKPIVSQVDSRCTFLASSTSTSTSISSTWLSSTSCWSCCCLLNHLLLKQSVWQTFLMRKFYLSFFNYMLNMISHTKGNCIYDIKIKKLGFHKYEQRRKHQSGNNIATLDGKMTKLGEAKLDRQQWQPSKSATACRVSASVMSTPRNTEKESRTDGNAQIS